MVLFMFYDMTLFTVCTESTRRYNFSNIKQTALNEMLEANQAGHHSACWQNLEHVRYLWFMYVRCLYHAHYQSWIVYLSSNLNPVRNAKLDHEHDACCRRTTLLQELYETWEDRRSANCDTMGGHSRSKQVQVDLSTYRKEEDFAEFFDEGEVVPIWDFLSSKGIDPTKIGSEAKQRKFVEEDSRDMIACFYMFLFVALKLVANHPIVKKEKTHLTLTPHHSLPCKPLNPTTHAMRTASMKDPESGSKISFFYVFAAYSGAWVERFDRQGQIGGHNFGWET